MAVSIRIDGLDRLQRQLGALGRQVPFAASKALTAVAFRVRAAEQDELRRAIDRPTPWTISRVRVKKATKRDLTAIVGSPSGVKNETEKWDAILTPHVKGGRRGPRGAERKLMAAGLMPSGWLAVPGPGIRLNSYGNLSRASWSKIINARNNRKLFVSMRDHPRTMHLPPGIYERTNRGYRIKPLVLFVRQATYTRRVKWAEVGRRTVNEHWRREFNQALEYAIRSAR